MSELDWDDPSDGMTDAGGYDLCPGGCGCRLCTDDADRFECGCDGGCCE